MYLLIYYTLQVLCYYGDRSLHRSTLAFSLHYFSYSLYFSRNFELWRLKSGKIRLLFLLDFSISKFSNHCLGILADGL